MNYVNFNLKIWYTTQIEDGISTDDFNYGLTYDCHMIDLVLFHITLLGHQILVRLSKKFCVGNFEDKNDECFILSANLWRFFGEAKVCGCPFMQTCGGSFITFLFLC